MSYSTLFLPNMLQNMFTGEIFLRFLPMIATYAVLFSILAYIAMEFHKLERFRRNVRPGNVVTIKTGYDIAIMTVKSRPSKDDVILTRLDNDRPFKISIHKIHPL